MAGKRETSEEKADSALVKKLEMLRRDGADAARGRVADAELSCAFLSGEQWVEYAWSRGICPVENPNDEIRETDNRMLNMYRRRMRYLFKEDPVMTAHTGGRDMRNTESALVASSICDFWEKSSGLREARKDAARWGAVAGLGLIMPIWAKNRGKRAKRTVLSYVKDGYTTESGRTSYIKRERKTGWGSEMKFVSLCPLSTYFFPLSASSWEKVEGVLNVELVSGEWMKTNVLGKDEILEDYEAQSPETVNLAALDSINDYTYGQFSLRKSTDGGGADDRYLVMRWWERPCPEHPDGRYVFIAGGRVIKDRKLPYVKAAREIDPADAHNLTLGIVPVFTTKLPGQLIPPSPMHVLREPQRRLNDTLTDVARNRKSVGRNKLLVEEGKLDREQYTDEHGEVIEIERGGSFDPQFLQAPPLAGIDKEIARAEYALEEMSGQTSVMRGRNPTQARAAWQLEILREEAMTLIEEEVAYQEEAYEKLARLSLAIAREKYDAEKIIQIVGFEREGMALTFQTAEINADMRIETGSMIPRNHALREAKLGDLAERGAFGGDPKSGSLPWRYFWKMSEMGTLNRTVTPEERQRVRARNEGVRMLVHEHVLIPYSHEDHEIHIEEHLSDMARDEWYSAPDRVKGLMEAHIEMHRSMYASQQIPSATTDMMPTEGVGGGGGGMPSGGSSRQVEFSGGPPETLSRAG